MRALRASERAGDDHDRLLAWAALVWDAPLEALLRAARREHARAPRAARRGGAAPLPRARPRVPVPLAAERDARLPATRFGAFAPGAEEFVLTLAGTAPDGGERPPMPWTNVVANERVGFLASESGAAYTWARNSREHRLTPWSNDPIADPHGEALYVRDEDGGVFWSPQPGPDAGAARRTRCATASATSTLASREPRRSRRRYDRVRRRATTR